MARWTAPDGVGIEYDIAGEGPAVVLLHGFASDARINWVRPGIVATLTGAGFMAVTYDARGHGRSDAPHDPSAYAGNAMVGDAAGLIDHLRLESPAVVGYSMGAQVAAWLALEEPTVRRLVLGGIGSRLLAPRPGERRYPAEAIASALEADDPSTIPDAASRAFRAFADATKADRVALAAIQRSRLIEGHPDLQALAMPVLILVGEADTLVGDPTALRRLLPQARVEIVPGDHLSAVVNPAFRHALVDFLGEGLNLRSR